MRRPARVGRRFPAQGAMMIADFQAHAANERTFLAWVRTVMAIVGFGLAVARIGPSRGGGWTEVALLVVGGAAIAIAYARMTRSHRRIAARGSFEADDTRADILLVVLSLALLATFGAFVLHVG